MADDSEQVSQDEIEALLRKAEAENPTEPEAEEGSSGGNQVDQSEIEKLLNQGADPAPSAPAPATDDQGVTRNDIELLFDKAEEALGSIDSPAAETVLPPGIKTFEFEKFGGTPANTKSATLELMGDVQLDMTIELGRTHMQLEEILKLGEGAVVPLDKLAGDPADIYVNGRLVARGEVLVLNDNFCIRVAELIEGENAVA